MSAAKFENCFLLKTRFPKNLLFQDILYVDEGMRSKDLIRKHNVNHVRFNNVYTNPAFEDVTIVDASIAKSETSKWKNIINDLVIVCQSNAYREACNSLSDHLRKFIIKK